MRNSYSLPEIMVSTRTPRPGYSRAPPDDYDFIRNALMERSQHFSELQTQSWTKTRIRRLAATANSLAKNLRQDYDSIKFSLDNVVTAANKDLNDKKMQATNKRHARSDINSLLSGIAWSYLSHDVRYSYRTRYTATKTEEKTEEFGTIYRK